MYHVLSLLLRQPYYSERLALLILGQSNASGRGRTTAAGATPEGPHPQIWLFGNDYIWKMAYEPVDDPLGQIDAVSDDTANIAAGYGHSFALRAAKGLVNGARRIDLLPCAKGGTAFAAWTPDANHLDRTTLYGSANYRRTVAVSSGEPTAILYYGHEDDHANSAGWAALIAATLTNWRVDTGAATPFIWCALSKHTDGPTSHNFHLCAEELRKCETGSGHANEQTGLYMVSTFDLSLIDTIHLDEVGQKTLGDRIALAIREHVLGEGVDGTGPRLATLSAPAANQIKVDTSQTLAIISGDADNQFRVFDNAVEMTVSSVIRDPADDSAALITMSAGAAGTVTVSYGDVIAAGTGITLANVVKNSAGLPLPQFGLQTVV